MADARKWEKVDEHRWRLAGPWQDIGIWLRSGDLNDCVQIYRGLNGADPLGPDSKDVTSIHICNLFDFIDDLAQLRDQLMKDDKP